MKLPLAVDIADCVVEAAQVGGEIDVLGKAQELVAVHPEAKVSVAEVEETLEEEMSTVKPSAANR